jgi:predicted aldo/keto reductase-like oxidoreductase
MKKNIRPNRISRRHFLVTGGAAAAAAGVPLEVPGAEPEGKPRINRYRTLGRTGFQVSDISMGGTQVPRANVYRYAYDQGINYFDTGESYGNGESERQLGQALKHMDREKYAMTKYARLDGRDASLCESCSAPCAGCCPHGVDIRSNLVRAHDLLTMI